MQNKVNLDQIQLTRFIAASAVMSLHLPFFSFGAWGVDIFFIISGFIISYTANNNKKDFFVKRLIRIVPIYWAVTLSVFLIALTYPSYLNNTTADVTHLLKSLFFIPFDKNGLGIYPVLYVGWTLNYEMLFYLVFAVSLAINDKFFTQITLIVITLLFVIGKINSESGIYFKFLSNSIILEFCLGILLWYIWNYYLQSKGAVQRSIVLIMLAGFMISVYFSYRIDDRFMSYGIASFFFVGFVLFSMFSVRIPKMLVLMGDSSYSLYLLHTYPILFAGKILNIFQTSGMVLWLSSLATVLACIMLSILSYKYFEVPVTGYLRKVLIK